MHISRCRLMQGLVRSYHQEWGAVGGGGGGGGERDVRYCFRKSQLSLRRQYSIVIILLLIKNDENICRILAAIEHEFFGSFYSRNLEAKLRL